MERYTPEEQTIGFEQAGVRCGLECYQSFSIGEKGEIELLAISKC
jgi:hypothetical protein